MGMTVAAEALGHLAPLSIRRPTVPQVRLALADGATVRMHQPSTRALTPPLAARASRCMRSWQLECEGDHSQIRSPDAGVARQIQQRHDREREVFEGLHDAASV